jgi:hypothetical protein
MDGTRETGDGTLNAERSTLNAERGPENMVGLTEADVRRRLDKQERGCLVAAVSLGLLALSVAAWALGLACLRWPALGAVLERLGWVMLAVGCALAVAHLVLGWLLGGRLKEADGDEA